MSNAVIRTEKITRTYSMGSNVITALREADLTVHVGEFIALMGASGSGKSTLLNVIGLLDRPTSGEYWLEEKPVSSLRRDELSERRGRRIGFIFQNFNLLPRLSAWENVALPLAYRNGQFRHPDQLARAREALSRVNLDQRADHQQAGPVEPGRVRYHEGPPRARHQDPGADRIFPGDHERDLPAP